MLFSIQQTRRRRRRLSQNYRRSIWFVSSTKREVFSGSETLLIGLFLKIHFGTISQQLFPPESSCGLGNPSGPVCPQMCPSEWYKTRRGSDKEKSAPDCLGSFISWLYRGETHFGEWTVCRLSAAVVLLERVFVGSTLSRSISFSHRFCVFSGYVVRTCFCVALLGRYFAVEIHTVRHRITCYSGAIEPGFISLRVWIWVR